MPVELLYRNQGFFIRPGDGRTFPVDLAYVVHRWSVQVAEAVTAASAWVEIDDDPRAGGDAPPDLTVDEADEALAQLLPDHDCCINLNRWRHARSGRHTAEWTVSITGFDGESIVSFEAGSLRLAVELAREHVQRVNAAGVLQVNAA